MIVIYPPPNVLANPVLSFQPFTARREATETDRPPLPLPTNFCSSPPLLSLQTRRGAFSLQTYKGNQARGKKAACFCGFNISAGGGLFAQGGGRKFFFPSFHPRTSSLDPTQWSGEDERGKSFRTKSENFWFLSAFLPAAQPTGQGKESVVLLLVVVVGVTTFHTTVS